MKLTRINVNPKIRNQVLLKVFSKKNTNKVANMTSGINIKPAPFGLGFYGYFYPTEYQVI